MKRLLHDAPNGGKLPLLARRLDKRLTCFVDERWSWLGPRRGYMYWFTAVRHWIMAHCACRNPRFGRLRVRPERRARWVWALALLAMASACKNSEPERPGRLVVTTQTDMSVPGGIDTIELRVEIGGEVRHAEVFEVAPVGDQKVPFVYELAAAEEPIGDVTITVVGRLGDQARVFARADTTFPEEQRTAVVELPLQWLCTGQIEDQDGAYASSCEPIKDQPAVCVAGECRVAVIAERSLPHYTPQNVFGGASKPGADGGCFPTETCFAVPTVVVPNADCQLEVEGAEQELNIALQLPVDAEMPTQSAGMCNSSGCFVPLDNDRRLGYSLLAGPDVADESDAGVGKLRVGLPKAVCAKLDAGDIIAVVTSNACVTKTPRIPTCGEWSSTENVLDIVIAPTAAGDASTDAALTSDAGDAGSSDEITLIVQGEYDGGALGVGATIQLIVEGTDSKDVIWTSSDEDVATVDENGLVTVVGQGTAIITATVDGKTVTFEITGVEADDDDDEITVGVIAQVAYLMLDPQQAMIPAGASVDITARGTLQDGRTVTVTKEVEWSSSNEDVASVEAGHVVGLRPGEVTIRIEGNGIAAEATVLVSDATLALLTVNPSEVTLPVGVAQALEATATYSNGQSLVASAAAAWSSGNEDIVQVDDNGVITALAVGETLVTAEFDGKTDTVFVKVTDAVLEGLSVEPDSLDLYKGQRGALVATAQYSDGQRVDVSAQVEWQSEDPAIATIAFEPQLGLRVTGVAEGTTTLAGTFGDQSIDVPVNVSAVSLLSLTLEPNTVSLPLGANTTLVLIGNYEDGRSVDVTEDAAWRTDSPQVATILSSGTVVAQALGSADITAGLGGLEAKSRVTVTDARLLNVSLAPREVTLIAGLTAQLTATASYSDGRSVPLTTQADWSSSTTAVVVNESGLLLGNTPGSGVITVAFGGFSATAAVTVADAALESLLVTSPETSVPAGTSIGLKAEARYTDGSTFDVTTDVVWRSDDTSVGIVSNAGLFTGNTPGDVGVSATLGSRTANVELEVTNALPVDVQITPSQVSLARGTSRTLSAMVEYSDGTSRVPGVGAVWSSRNQTVATVNNNGVVQGVNEGTTEIALTFAGLERRVSVAVTTATPTQLTVTPDTSVVAAGQSVRFTALVTYSDGSSTPVTSGVTWRSLSPMIATVDSATGVALSTAPGTAVIEGAFGELVDTESFAVMEAAVQTLEVTPLTSSVAKGNRVQFTAVATYTDGFSLPVTNLATWRSGNNGIASVSGGGLARAVDPGATTITASFGGQTASAQLTVRNAELTGIRIVPAEATVAATNTQVFVAEGDYTDGSRATVSPTWSTSNSQLATIDNQGRARGVRPGNVEIIASLSGFQARARLTVTDVPLVGLQIQPINPSVPSGTTLQFTAVGTYGDGSTAPVQATFTSSNTSRLQVNSATGLATATAIGNVNVTATLGALTSTTSAQVTAGTLTGLTLTPATASAAAGRAVTLTATATYTDGRSTDVSVLAEWRTSNSTFATVREGVVTTRAAGSVVITTTYLGQSAQATITVGNAVVERVLVSPPTASVPLGVDQQLTARAVYSDGSEAPVTTTADWQRVSGESVTVDAGLVRPRSIGSSVVRATFQEVTGSSTVTVVDAIPTGLRIEPTEGSVIVDTTLPLTATELYSDGSTQLVNTRATWTTSNGTRASVSNGLVRGLVAGETPIIITASVDGFSATASVVVVAASITSITVSGESLSVAVGLTRDLTATATYNNGTSRNVTAEATWSSSSPTIMTVAPPSANASAVVTGRAPGNATATATLGSVAGSARITVTDAVVQGLRLAPPTLALIQGQQGNMRLFAQMSGGTEQEVTSAATTTWESESATIASVGAGGVVSANGAGRVRIFGNYQTFRASADVSVSQASISSLRITLGSASIPAGTTTPVSVQALWNNDTTTPVTTNASWTSSNANIASVTNGAAVVRAGGQTGPAQLTATVSGVAATVTLTVTEATVTGLDVVPAQNTLVRGTSVQLQATATFSDGSSRAVTTEADTTWVTSDDKVAAMLQSKGWFSGVAAGTATITARYRGASNTATIRVTEPEVLRLRVEPPEFTLDVDNEQRLRVIGSLSNGQEADVTSAVTWNIDNKRVVTINDSAVVTALSPGEARITATYEKLEADSFVVVLDNSTKYGDLFMCPPMLSIPVGGKYALAVMGETEDGYIQDISRLMSWSSGDQGISVNSTGLLSASAAVRAAKVEATYMGEVVFAELSSFNSDGSYLEVDPPVVRLEIGGDPQQVRVRAIARQASTDVTANVSWSVENEKLADVYFDKDELLVVDRGNPGCTVVTFMYQQRTVVVPITISGSINR